MLKQPSNWRVVLLVYDNGRSHSVKTVVDSAKKPLIKSVFEAKLCTLAMLSSSGSSFEAV